MTCKDCAHYELCEALEKNGISRIYPSQCGFFKDKLRFIELPCKVGDTVYKFNTLSNRIDEEIIEEFRIGKNYINLMSDTFDGVICRADQIGKVENDLYYVSGYFLSKGEAIKEASKTIKGKPVGRCGECKHSWNQDEYGYINCTNLNVIMKQDDFCSLFEHKETKLNEKF